MHSATRLSLAVLLGAAPAAVASHTYQVTITATSSLGTATTTFTGNDAFLRAGTVNTAPLGSSLGEQALGWAWNQSSSTVMSSGGTALATVGRTATSFIDDPVVLLGFNVQAGAADTLFTISSIFVSTDPLTPYQVTAASAAITATDGGAGNGTSVVGALPGGNAFAFRNNGIDFGYLITGGTSSGFQSLVASGTYSSPAAITGISTISSVFSFTLSANDTASGTSLYRIDVIPAPAASAVLLGAGLLAGSRRRR